jgi:spermidine synthase
MLATYALSATPPKRALLIGLGGGAMVHALHAYDPHLELDVVEIDPVVVRLARQYFGVKALESSLTPSAQLDTSKRQPQSRPTPSWKLRLFTEDGFKYLRRDLPHRYDMIWMDAFLQPTAQTDSTGSPLNLKTRDFLKEIAAKHLTQRGVIAININHHSGLRRDINTIRAAFPASTVWQVPQTGNYIAVGFRQPITVSADQLRVQSLSLTSQQATPFNYNPLLERALQGMQPPLK